MVIRPLVLRRFNRFSIAIGVLETECGVIEVVWYNMPYIKNTLNRNMPYVFYGKVSEKLPGERLVPYQDTYSGSMEKAPVRTAFQYARSRNKGFSQRQRVSSGKEQRCTRHSGAADR